MRRKERPQSDCRVAAYATIRFVQLQRNTFSLIRPNNILAGDETFQTLTSLPEPVVISYRRVLTRKELTSRTSQPQWRSLSLSNLLQRTDLQSLDVGRCV